MKKLLVLLVSMSLWGCAGNIQYKSVDTIDNVTMQYGLTDFNMIVDEMVADIKMTFPDFGDRPLLFAHKVKNETSEHINTADITRAITSKIRRARIFRVTNTESIQAVVEQMQYQQESGLVNQATAVRSGKHVGAKYMLYGSISSIRKATSAKTSRHYYINLRIVDVETNVEEWSFGKQIYKENNRAFFGP